MQRPDIWQDWLAQYEFLGISSGRWLAALAVALVVGFVSSLAKSILVRRAAKLAKRTTSGWDDALVQAIDHTKWWFLLTLALFCGSVTLMLPERTPQSVETAAVVVLLLQAGLWGNVLISIRTQQYTKERVEGDPAGVMTVSALAFVAKLVLFSVLALLALDNLGIDVTALIAGLGVGGIAVALAVQNILGDLLASLSIVFDKPFVLGDFIIVGDQMGTVEKIGLKTTRIRSLSGEQLVFANNDLLQSRIRNFKRMYERRVVFSLGVTYQTPAEKLESIPGMIRGVVESQEEVRFDRSHFKEFGDSALVIETVYYVLVPDYARYMDIQQSINLSLFRLFESEGIEFAYPTRTIHLEKADV